MTRASALPTLLAAGSFAAPGEVSAEIPPVSAGELYSRCLAYSDDRDGVDGRACAAYIRGLLDGSQTVGRAEGSRRELFRERALRTRAGARYASLSRYCLAASVSLDQLVAELLERRVTDPDSTPASTAVYRSLRRLQDCPRH